MVTSPFICNCEVVPPTNDAFILVDPVFRFPPIPTPPATTRAPVVVLVLVVAELATRLAPNVDWLATYPPVNDADPELYAAPLAQYTPLVVITLAKVLLIPELLAVIPYGNDTIPLPFII
jgi:hypothetical protein